MLGQTTTGYRIFIAVSLWACISTVQAAVIYDGGTPNSPISITGLSLANGLFDANITYNVLIEGSTLSGVGATGSSALDVAVAMVNQLNLTGIDSFFIDGLFIVTADLVGGFAAARAIDQVTGPGNWAALGIQGHGDRNARSAGFVELVRAVPEPSTLALLGLGAAGLGFARRRVA
jgi:hypothetical protein